MLGFQATKLRLNASFERMIPTQHPYIVNYFEHKADLVGLGNSIAIAVETPEGTIFDPAYLETLRQINDEVFYIPGVDRGGMKSLWTPATRWAEVTEEGSTGGRSCPTPMRSPKFQEVKQTSRGLESGSWLQTISSPIIYVPLLENNPETGKPLDYKLSQTLEDIRDKQNVGVKMHIIGFAKLVGDLIDGLMQVMTYFAIAASSLGPWSNGSPAASAVPSW